MSVSAPRVASRPVPERPPKPRRSRPLAAALSSLIALTAAPVAHAAPTSATAPPANVRELKVLTYNIKGLPVLTNLDRLKRIGEILAERRRLGDEPDVVVLQEAFVRKSQRVRDRAGYPYAIQGPTGGGLFANGSGLEVLSNHPIVARHERRLNDCAFPECLVSKAVVGVTLGVPGLPGPVDVFTTHLQADTRNDRVRRNQIDDITVFLDRIRFGRAPAIFAGDFNFKPRHESYRKFLREMPFADAGFECLAALETCEVVIGVHGQTDGYDVWKTTNDRQFYYQPADSPLRIEPIRVIRNFTEPARGGEGGFLSDHWGYEVHYRIHW